MNDDDLSSNVGDPDAQHLKANVENEEEDEDVDDKEEDVDDSENDRRNSQNVALSEICRAAKY
jgi:hypothetical protein